MKTIKNGINTGNINVGMLWYFSQEIKKYYNMED